MEYSNILILSLESDRANKRITAEKDIFSNFYYITRDFIPSPAKRINSEQENHQTG